MTAAVIAVERIEVPARCRAVPSDERLGIVEQVMTGFELV